VIRSLFRYPYNTFVRPYLPRKIGMMNGVAVRWPRLFDIDDHTPDWKAGTVSAVRESITSADTVVEIGGGFGVCTVWAAREAEGPNGAGEVISFEAAENRVEVMRETIELNKVSDAVSVRHAVVGESVDVFGEMEGASKVSPAELPNCDVLVMDCEGAEFDILKHIQERDDWRPDRVVVETHGFAGAPTDEIKTVLRELGYSIAGTRLASPHNSGEENDVILASHDSS